ncbi:N-acetylglucosamine-6-phosphate deacetylase [bacterium]|nr:N-acetylglucosamine-6-phosphate deacetylase [bacterium]
MTWKVLMGGSVVTPAGLHEGAEVLIEGDRIREVGHDLARPEGVEVLDVRGALIAPGFIDAHIHGGLEFDTMDASLEALSEISGHLAHHGVTSWLPTTVACEASLLDRILSAVAEARDGAPQGARILGAHLESNFLSPKYKGAQPAECLRPVGDQELRAVLARHASTIRLLTLAPELDGADGLIRELVAQGVVVSVGHSDATYAQVLSAVDAGSTRVTHLCNAQRGFHHREPGVLGAGLVCDALFTEVIADLEHVHPAGLTIAYRCKGSERLMLVSDAVRGTGLPPGEYELGGQTTFLDGHTSRFADGTIAGSVITLDRAVRNMVQMVKVPLHEAIAMASDVPARSLGLSHLGRVAPGYLADLVLLSHDLDVRATFVGGRLVHQA